MPWSCTCAAPAGSRRSQLAISDPGGELGVPVTLLWGRWDLLLPPRQRLRARARLPAALVGLLPDCGYLPMWDNPQLVAHVLLVGST